MQQKSFSSLVFIGTLIIVLTAVYLAGDYFLIQPSKTPAPSQANYPTIYVEAEKVIQKPFAKTLTTVGILKANESIVIRSEIDGRISSIPFQGGEALQKGDTLLILDDSLAKARLAEAQAKLSLATTGYKRAQILFEKLAGSLKEKEKAFVELEIAQADLNMAQSSLEKTVIKAPFEGFVGTRTLSVGSYIRAGEDLGTLDDIDPIKVDFKVGEVYFPLVKVGQLVTLKIDGFPDKTFTGTIETIDAKIDAVTHSILVRATLDNKDSSLKPGLFSSVTLTLEENKNALLVPEISVLYQGTASYLYKVIEGVATLTPIKVGNRDGKNVEILAGNIKAGDLVITAGQIKVGDGVPVTVVPSQADIPSKEQ